MDGFRIRRDLPSGRYPLHRLAEELEHVPALIRYFGEERALTKFLSGAEIEVDSFQGFMWVDPDEECVKISGEYLQEADEIALYLDLIHEVVHLRQLSQGRELFDKKYSYDQRPTELEAYRVSLEEARRLGCSDEFLREYLKVPWITEKQYTAMLVSLGVED